MESSKDCAPDIELTLTAENQKRVEAERQRDQLLAALEWLVGVTIMPEAKTEEMALEHAKGLLRVNSAIAAAKGGQS